MIYYQSSLWRSDFEADEAGELPADLPRGVLSEDAIYNVLTEYEVRKSRKKGSLGRNTAQMGTVLCAYGGA